MITGTLSLTSVWVSITASSAGIVMSVDPSYAKLDAERVPFVLDVERDKLLEELNYVRSLFDEKLPVGTNRNAIMEYFNMVEEVISTNQPFHHDFPSAPDETGEHLQVADATLGPSITGTQRNEAHVPAFASHQPPRR